MAHKGVHGMHLDNLCACVCDYPSHLHGVPAGASAHYIAIEGVQDALVGQLQWVIQNDHVSCSLDFNRISSSLQDSENAWCREILQHCWGTASSQGYKLRKLPSLSFRCSSTLSNKHQVLGQALSCKQWLCSSCVAQILYESSLLAAYNWSAAQLWIEKCQPPLQHQACPSRSCLGLCIRIDDRGMPLQYPHRNRSHAYKYQLPWSLAQAYPRLSCRPARGSTAWHPPTANYDAIHKARSISLRKVCAEDWLVNPDPCLLYLPLRCID